MTTKTPTTTTTTRRRQPVRVSIDRVYDAVQREIVGLDTLYPVHVGVTEGYQDPDLLVLSISSRDDRWDEISAAAAHAVEGCGFRFVDSGPAYYRGCDGEYQQFRRA